MKLNKIVHAQDIDSRLSRIRAGFYTSFKHHVITTSQGNVAIWDSHPDFRGDCPSLILIHGHCTNKEFFEKQLRSPLFANYRLLALDLPGYGESPPPKDPEKTYSFPGFAKVVAEIVNILKLGNLGVLGWSLGGHVALELTSCLPQLKGLLITGTPPIEISDRGLSCGFRVLNPKILECFGKGNLSYEEAQLLATISGYDFSEEKEFLIDAILETDEGAKTIYPQSIAKGIGQNELEIVSEWTRPIAVIAGEQDPAINNNYILHDVKFKNLWEGKVHMISNGGHAVFMDCPDEFNSLMHRFVQYIFKN